MIDLHYWTTPNGHKITIFLEETGLPYKIFPVNIGKGEQFAADFLKISPNNRIPAMVDHEPKGGGKPVSIFESGAMLLYLAEKTGKFLPADLHGRGQAGRGARVQLRSQRLAGRFPRGHAARPGHGAHVHALHVAAARPG